MNKLFALLLFFALPTLAVAETQVVKVSSLDERIEVRVDASASAVTYSVRRDGKMIFKPSKLGYRFNSGLNLIGGLTLVIVKSVRFEKNGNRFGERIRRSLIIVKNLNLIL